MLYSIHPSKRRMSELIARQTEEYLARGGVIEVVPSVYHAPPHMQWIARKKMDYTPWEHLGFPSTARNSDQLCDGCYITLPAIQEE